MATKFYIATGKQTDNIDSGVTSTGLWLLSCHLHTPVTTSLLNDDGKM